MHMRTRSVGIGMFFACARLMNECFNCFTTYVLIVFFIEVHLGQTITDHLEIDVNKKRTIVYVINC